MSKSVELTDSELSMIVEALQEAAFFRDARSRVVRRAARKKTGAPDAGAEDRAKVRDYQALALRLGSSK